jgi:hypothetical protein
LGAGPYSRAMKLVGVAALLLTASPLVVACGSDPTCDDVGRLQAQLDGMRPDDPDYNTTVEKLQRAEADCNM